MGLWDFLFEQVCFVQEEDGGGLCEPIVRKNGLEQGEAFFQSILGKGGQIIFRQQRRVHNVEIDGGNSLDHH